MGEIERDKEWDLILKFEPGFPCLGPWLPSGISQWVILGGMGSGLDMGKAERGFGGIG